MPTLDQTIEKLQKKREKFGGSAHCNQVFVSEEVSKEQIENAPDEKGCQHTRIGLETYSPKAYSAWNAMKEELMQRCGCNPIIVVDLLLVLVRLAQRPLRDDPAWVPVPGEPRDGIDIALHGLFSVMDYEQELRDQKEQRRLRKNGAQPVPLNPAVPQANLKGEG